MSNTDSTPDDDENHFETLEDRISTLEAENERLTEHLDRNHGADVSVSRRQALAGLVGGSMLFGASGTASAQRGDDDDPFAQEGHDHSGDYLGQRQPINRIAVDKVFANEISTTRYADSIAELNTYLEEAPNRTKMSEQSGVKIVLREGTLQPSADDLPIELKNGVVIEGHGEKATRIDARDIGKPVFKYDRSDQAIGRKVALRDLGVRGNGTDDADAKGVPGSKGVLFNNIHFYLIENCTFLGLEEGLVLRGCWTGTIQNIHVDQCHRDGLRFKSTQQMGSNDLQVTDSEFKRSGRHNINIEGTLRPNGPPRPAKGVLLAGNDTSGAGKYAIRIVGGQGVTIHGCYTEANASGRPLTEPLDRNDDGTIDPVQIALSPGSDDIPTQGISITGSSIGKAGNGGSDTTTSTDVGIKLNRVRGVHIAGNYRWWKPDGALVELGPEMKNVTIGSNALEGPGSHSIVTGPLDGSTIPPHELNDGIWRTSALGGFEDLATLAEDFVDKRLDNGIEIILTDDLSGGAPVIDGSNFPAGTLFRGVGMQATSVGSENSSGPVIELAHPAQALANLNVLAGDSTAVHVGLSARKGVLTNIVCDATIDVDGNGTRVIGCDAPVNTDDASIVLDLSLDTGGLDPNATGNPGSGDDDPMAKLTVTQDSPNHWRRMSQKITVNLDESPVLGITVPDTTGRWNVAVADGSESVKLFQDSSNTGTFTANVAEMTGWSGEKTFTIRLYVVGYDEPVYVDRLGLYNSPDSSAAAWEDEFRSLSDAWNIKSGLEVKIVSETE